MTGEAGPLPALAVAPTAVRNVERALLVLLAPGSIVVGAIALVRTDPRARIDLVLLALVAAWAVAGAALGVRRRTQHLGVIALATAGLLAAVITLRATDSPRASHGPLALLPALAFHLLSTLPDGRIRARRTQRLVVGAYVAGALLAVVNVTVGSSNARAMLAAAWIVAVGLGLRLANRNYQQATANDRRQMQWVGWSLAVVAELVLLLAALRLIAGAPSHPEAPALAATALVPVALLAATHVRLVTRVDRLLTATVSAAGITALTIFTYGAVVVALGRRLHQGERSLLLLSMVASAVAALLYAPVRDRLTTMANEVIYGEHVAPDEALRTWGSRLSRAIPLDELLLQLTESLRSSMSLASAEIFTGIDGRFELVAGVPHRAAPAVIVGQKERAVVARAGVSGGTWLGVWLPALAETDGRAVRVAPIAHGGELLGLIVVARPPAADHFCEDDDAILTELARQVSLALHNVQLDSALQASLLELQQANTNLQESRRRIVTAGDAERRKLERNLHDGAQQHLVAMAVKLRLAEELIDDDRDGAVSVIAELRQNLKDAIAELRSLAHGIFPPLLMSGGLREALPAAAGRSALPTTVETVGVERYGPDIESTVYFCCLEAMQNAGKHAGPEAEIAIRVEGREGRLTFEVVDDGIGFALDGAATSGHGFVNMSDRLGTVGGQLTVTSTPEHGTCIRGEIPLP